MFNDQDSATRRIKICLEKPTAVTFADAPAVEFTLSCDTQIATSSMRYNVAELPPFPLQGRLDDWIGKTYPGHPDSDLTRISNE